MVSEEEREFRNSLVKDVAEYFHSYIGKGVRVPGPTEIESEAWDDPTPTLNIDGLREILRVHFVLTGFNQEPTVDEEEIGVIPFVHNLPDRARRLKKKEIIDSEVVDGGVQGKIDWGKTVDMYRQQGFIDRTRFVCVRNEDDFQTQANQVLRILLLRIQSVFQNELKAAVESPEDYPWLTEWVGERDRTLKSVVDQVLRENPVMRQLEELERQNGSHRRQVSARQVQSVKQARRPIYREAAHLLERYKRIVDEKRFSKAEARTILKNAYIRPDSKDGSRLFELYWVYHLLSHFDNPGLETVKSGTSLVAKWQSDGFRYKLYHTGGDQRYRYKIDLETAEDALLQSTSSEGYFERSFSARRDSIDFISKALDYHPNETMWSGTPDILFIKEDLESESVDGVLVGEVKYSSTKTYLKDGLEELLEYVYLMRHEEGYEIEEPYTRDDIPNHIEPVLFTDSIDEPIDDAAIPISIVSYGDEYTPFGDSSE